MQCWLLSKFVSKSAIREHAHICAYWILPKTIIKIYLRPYCSRHIFFQIAKHLSVCPMRWSVSGSCRTSAITLLWWSLSHTGPLFYCSIKKVSQVFNLIGQFWIHNVLIYNVLLHLDLVAMNLDGPTIAVVFLEPIYLMILSFRTDIPGQTVQTPIRLLSILFAIPSASFGLITLW